MTITPEQAVTLAEWLGCQERDHEILDVSLLSWFAPRGVDKGVGKTNKWRYIGGLPKLAGWFYSPEGQEALMDRMLKGPSWIGVEIYIPPDEELQGQAFSVTIRSVDQDEIIECGKTRQEALIRACLQVAEKEIQK